MIQRRPASPVLILVLAVGACSSIPDAPIPLTFDIRPLGEGYLTLEALSRPADGGRRLSAPPPPPLPLPQPRIEWWPERPLQGSVVALRIVQPAGPPLEDVRVRFAGRAVSLEHDASRWIGLGGLPLDSAGFFAVELEFTRGRERESKTVVVRAQERAYTSTRISISAGGAANPELDARIARERDMISAALASSSPVWIPDEPIGWPRRPPIKTSPFGQRRMFNGRVRSRHLGLDLRARRGNPIMAAAAGRVALAGRFVYQGNAVYLDHGLGLFTAYFHMSRLEVQVGDLVEPGQVLGRSGSTGRSTAPHLHWSAYVRGVTVDPESLVGLSFSPQPIGSAKEEPR